MSSPELPPITTSDLARAVDASIAGAGTASLWESLAAQLLSAGCLSAALELWMDLCVRGEPIPPSLGNIFERPDSVNLFKSELGVSAGASSGMPAEKLASSAVQSPFTAGGLAGALQARDAQIALLQYELRGAKTDVEALQHRVHTLTEGEPGLGEEVPAGGLRLGGAATAAAAATTTETETDASAATPALSVQDKGGLLGLMRECLADMGASAAAIAVDQEIQRTGGAVVHAADAAKQQSLKLEDMYVRRVRPVMRMRETEAALAAAQSEAAAAHAAAEAANQRAAALESTAATLKRENAALQARAAAGGGGGGGGAGVDSVPGFAAALSPDAAGVQAALSASAEARSAQAVRMAALAEYDTAAIDASALLTAVQAAVPTLARGADSGARAALLPLLTSAVALHPAPEARSEMLLTMLTMHRRPDAAMRDALVQQLLRIAEAWAAAASPDVASPATETSDEDGRSSSAVEQHMLPVILSLATARVQERRALAAQACGAIAQWLSPRRVDSVLATLTLLADDEEPAVRADVVSALASLCAQLGERAQHTPGDLLPSPVAGAADAVARRQYTELEDLTWRLVSQCQVSAEPLDAADSLASDSIGGLPAAYIWAACATAGQVCQKAGHMRQAASAGSPSGDSAQLPSEWKLVGPDAPVWECAVTRLLPALVTLAHNRGSLWTGLLPAWCDLIAAADAGDVGLDLPTGEDSASADGSSARHSAGSVSTGQTWAATRRVTRADAVRARSLAAALLLSLPQIAPLVSASEAVHVSADAIAAAAAPDDAVLAAAAGAQDPAEAAQVRIVPDDSTAPQLRALAYGQADTLLSPTEQDSPSEECPTPRAGPQVTRAGAIALALAGHAQVQVWVSDEWRSVQTTQSGLHWPALRWISRCVLPELLSACVAVGTSSAAGSAVVTACAAVLNGLARVLSPAAQVGQLLVHPAVLSALQLQVMPESVDASVLGAGCEPGWSTLLAMIADDGTAIDKGAAADAAKPWLALPEYSTLLAAAGPHYAAALLPVLAAAAWGDVHFPRSLLSHAMREVLVRTASGRGEWSKHALPHVASAVVLAGHAGGQEVAAILLSVLGRVATNPDAAVKRATAGVLQELGPQLLPQQMTQAALPLLQKLCSDSHVEVARAGAQAVSALLVHVSSSLWMEHARSAARAHSVALEAVHATVKTLFQRGPGAVISECLRGITRALPSASSEQRDGPLLDHVLVLVRKLQAASSAGFAAASQASASHASESEQADARAAAVEAAHPWDTAAAGDVEEVATGAAEVLRTYAAAWPLLPQETQDLVRSSLRELLADAWLLPLEYKDVLRMAAGPALADDTAGPPTTPMAAFAGASAGAGAAADTGLGASEHQLEVDSPTSGAPGRATGGSPTTPMSAAKATSARAGRLLNKFKRKPKP